MKRARFLRVNFRDLWKSAQLAMISAGIDITNNIIGSGSAVDWATLKRTVIVIFSAYIIKSFFSNSRDQLLKKEPPAPKDPQ